MLFQSYKVMIKNIGNEIVGNFMYLTENKEMIIGRQNPHSKVDLPIFNNLVSRNHCKLFSKNGEIYIEDLDSKHGTEVDGQRLTPFLPTCVKVGQKITLVSGLITLQIDRNNEETIDLTRIRDSILEQQAFLNDSFQTVQIKNDVIKMTNKEYQCFSILFQNLGDITTREEIVTRVWPERIHESDTFVTDEEITSLIYRVRRKTKKHFEIKSVVNKGYYLKYK